MPHRRMAYIVAKAPVEELVPDVVPLRQRLEPKSLVSVDELFELVEILQHLIGSTKRLRWPSRKRILVAARFGVHGTDDVAEAAMALLERLDVEVPEHRKVVAEHAKTIALLFLARRVHVEEEPSGKRPAKVRELFEEMEHIPLQLVKASGTSFARGEGGHCAPVRPRRIPERIPFQLHLRIVRRAKRE